MTNATFTTNPNAIPEQAYDMLGEAKATRLDGDGFFKDMYEVASGDRRVVVILDTNCVRWMAYAKGYGLHKMGRRPAQFWRQDKGWTPVSRRHEFGNTDRSRITCVRNALRWLEA